MTTLYNATVAGNAPKAFRRGSGLEAGRFRLCNAKSAMAEDQHPNRLLASLPPADFELFRPHLKPIDLVHEVVLFAAGDQLQRVYFPHSGVISLVINLSDGQMIEAAMVGRDSMAGGAAALDGRVALNTAIVQVAGAASVLDVEALGKVAQHSGAFRAAMMRHEQILLAQAQQSAACNASHTVEARLARWLLWTRDLSGSDTLGLTQEFVAQMLGVRRTSVSLVANTLQNAGLIRYRRGRIEITDLQGLRAASCECYSRVKTHYDRLLGVSPK
jgi:CRP-like cAMP-binding protein